jgi:hypothetical protein
MQARIEKLCSRRERACSNDRLRPCRHRGGAVREWGRRVNQLKTYASALKDGRAASPAPGSAVESALNKELQDLYRTQPDLRTKIQDAVNAAKNANPGAWISKITLSK